MKLRHTTENLEVCEAPWNGEVPPNEYTVGFDGYIVATFWDGVQGKSNAKENATLYAASSDMLEMLLHLYVNYELPYGVMDIETKSRFKNVIEKATGKKIKEVLNEKL